ncbi:peroxidase, partial [Tsukamurella pulmonis]
WLDAPPDLPAGDAPPTVEPTATPTPAADGSLGIGGLKEGTT